MLLLCLILAACGEPKVGDTFRLERNTVGGMDINSMDKTVDEMRKLQEMGDPDSVEEHLDLSEINSFSVGTVVRVTEISDKHNMFQIESINPKTGDNMKMWIKGDELKRALH